jgi:hypothetical protein
MPPEHDTTWADRLALRRVCRQLLHQRTDRQLHLMRIQAALALKGTEPVQGALADVFSVFGAQDSEFKSVALKMARGRMATRVVALFQAQVTAVAMPGIQSLATRWSILARPTADITTRARRCSPDDSRALAEQALVAFRAQDAQALQEFFLHCLTCHDKLAFMLARRGVLQLQSVLPAEWEAVSLQLERHLEPA